MYFSVSSAVFSGLEVAGLTGFRNLTGRYPASGARPGSCAEVLHIMPREPGAAAQTLLHLRAARIFVATVPKENYSMDGFGAASGSRAGRLRMLFSFFVTGLSLA